jgi:sialate O-acetylesterase
MHHRLPSLIPFALILGAIATMRAADFKLAALFADHMILQRDKPVAFWGWADAGERVTISFAGQSKSTTVDADGKWSLKLDAMAASAEPRVLLITGREGRKVEVRDVLVGEVWLASGQSNMGWNLAKTTGGAEAAAAAADPLLRLAKIPQRIATDPLHDVANAAWRPSTPETAAAYSGVAYHFAREIRRTQGVPVGIITSAFPASTCQAWIPVDTLKSDPLLSDYIVKWDQRIAEFDSAKAMARQNAETKADKPAANDPRRMPMRPSVLFNGMIHPLVPFTLRGAIWYQAEGNNGDPNFGRCFPAMIQAWREAWNQSRLPFLFVQLPKFNGFVPETREIQASCARSVPDTAMVVTIDLGEAENIHPADKQAVGSRLALKARTLVYGEKIEHSGPVFKSMQREGENLVLHFDHAEGMKAGDGDLRGFEVAGADGSYSSALAAINGSAIRLRSAEVKAPMKARYAWSRVPDANLINSAGLPAAPFRSSLSETPKTK